jgi:hypothetical protein
VRSGGKVEFKVDSGVNRGAGHAQQGWQWGDASRVEPGEAPRVQLISDRACSMLGMHP